MVATPARGSPTGLERATDGRPVPAEHRRDGVSPRSARPTSRAFWLAGHSQGGDRPPTASSATDYFRSRVTACVSLSGGRLGPSRDVPPALDPAAAPAGGTPPPPRPRRRAPVRRASLPACDFSYIYAIGQHEDRAACPPASPWAAEYGCAARAAPRRVVDTGRLRRGRRSRPPQRRSGAASPARGSRGLWSIRTARAAASSPTWCASTRATPRALSRR